MQSFYSVASDNKKDKRVLGRTERYSVFYHNLFDYPLTFADLIKWNVSEDVSITQSKTPVIRQNGYLFLQRRGGLIYKRVLRSRISAKKMEIAKGASKILSLIPSIKMVGVTGSLAMGNAADESDIDLFVITTANSLWVTRVLSYLVLKISGFDLRRAGNKNQKDKICLNMWIDETDLIWKKGDRNLYTAHEIGQVIPLLNRNETYERFIWLNKWILKFWPNCVRIRKMTLKSEKDNFQELARLVNLIAFKLQHGYMKKKITREVVTPTRAIFHPQDWGRVILSRLA